MTADSPIEIINLRKEFGDFVAVDGLSLSVKRNSFTGVLGPNGAGKSTTLKILTNLITASSGNAYLNGYDVTKNPVDALMTVGTVVETPEFYPYMTPNETFSYIGEILGMFRESIKSETSEILEKVKMTEWADIKIGTFSKGMRQRIAIGQALINEPNVIILDEPTSGLDPRGMAEMREILKNIRNDTNDLTILMSSHMMYEVTDLCDRIAMVNYGKLIAHDSIDKFIEDSDIRTIIIRTADVPTSEMISTIKSIENVVDAEREGNDIAVKFRGEKIQEVSFFKTLGSLNINVYNMSESTNVLEEKYLSMIKESR